MTGTQLRLLQEFALEWQGTRIELPSGMQRLLALLALKGPAHRCLVAGTLWPEVPEVQALGSLRTSIWRINRKLPGCIVTDGVGLAARNMRIDSLEQEVVTKRLLREQLEDPLWITEHVEILCRGELLPGWYDEWVLPERERLSQLRLHALERAAVALSRSGHFAEAIQLALEAVRAEPLRETANAALITVYLAEGNVSDAIYHYRVFRRRLRRELGVDPSPSLRALLPRTAVALSAPPDRPRTLEDGRPRAGALAGPRWREAPVPSPGFRPF